MSCTCTLTPYFSICCCSSSQSSRPISLWDTYPQPSCSLGWQLTRYWTWLAGCEDWGHTCSDRALVREWEGRRPAAPGPGRLCYQTQRQHPARVNHWRITSRIRYVKPMHLRLIYMYLHNNFTWRRYACAAWSKPYDLLLLDKICTHTNSVKGCKLYSLQPMFNS